jgi:hypothetical protein
MTPRVAVVGCGRTGARVASLLAGAGAGERELTVEVSDALAGRADALAARLGDRVVSRGDGVARRALDAAVLCVPRAAHRALALNLLAAGTPLVSISDDLDETTALLELGPQAARRGVPVVVGAGFAPGLSCLLARHAGNLFDEVDEVHVCRAGTGGPACARQHHAALTGAAVDWRDGEWVRRRGGSGRQLAHFPEPIGPRDCYRAALPDALLLHRAFPGARRITARLAATRRDRLSAPLPMMRAPHPDGGPGAVRVEVWGRRDGASEVTIYGTMGSPADIAAAVAATATAWVVAGRFAPGVTALGEPSDPVPFLAALDRVGVHMATFEGVA